MKLNRKFAWLLTAPLAWASGCGGGPMSGLVQREPVISLEQPDPLVALRRSSAVESAGADSGAVSTADWLAAEGDPEAHRLTLLSGMRRKMNQQMMMMPMMAPMTAVPQHPTGTAGGPSGKTGPTSGGSKSSTSQTARPAATPQQALPPYMMQGMMTPEMMAEMGRPSRRNRGGRTRDESKLDREETAASTEADRIERAAQAEASRAEKAALAEATLAERRLMAEAELAERMTRAEVELAERLAAAKQDRDLRISTAREERSLRMAILGIDPQELGADPVDEALARIDESKPRLGTDDSGLTRFTKFFRSKTVSAEAAAGGDAPRQSNAQREPREEAVTRSRDTDGRDLIDRTLEHSDSLLDDPSIAEFASSIPADTSRVARRESTGDRPAATDSGDEYDSLLARESLDRGEPRRAEDWSLLDDFLKSGGDAPIAATTPASEARDFPAAEGASAIATNESSLLDGWPNSSPESTEPADSIAAAGESPGRTPDDDVWILGQRPEGNDPTATPAVAEAAPSYSAESFTRPSGLYARGGLETDAPPVAGGSPPSFPSIAAAAAGSSLEDALLPTTDNAGPSSDAWVDPAATTVAESSPSDVPTFDWSHSADEPANRVVTHVQPPAPQTAIHNAAWSSQSLRDVCGQLPADLDALVLQLDIPEAGVRKAVLADLARLQAKARPAVPAVRVLLDDSPLVAAHAAWTLWQIEGNETDTVNELVRLLQTGDPETVQFSAYALGSMGPKALSAAETLRAERERFNGATRVHVAEALTRIDAFDQASVEVLMSGLQHPETQVRWLSAVALGETQVRYADLAVPALVNALHDSDAEVRSAAALSLGGFGKAAHTAVPELQSRATLDAPSVREAAQTALACVRL